MILGVVLRFRGGGVSRRRINQRASRRIAGAAGAATAIVLSPVSGTIAAPVQTLCTGDCVLNAEGDSIDIDLDANGTEDVRAQLHFNTSGTTDFSTQLNLARLGQSLNVKANIAGCFCQASGGNCTTVPETVSNTITWTNYFYIPALAAGHSPRGNFDKTSEAFARFRSSTWSSICPLTKFDYNATCASGAYSVSGGLCYNSCLNVYVTYDCTLRFSVLESGGTYAGEVQFDHNGTNQGWVWAKREGGMITVVGWGYDDESGQRNSMPDPPTAVRLSASNVSWNDGRARLTWETASETDTVGFNVLRAHSPDGPFVQINTSMIPAGGAVDFGHTYLFVDEDVEEGTHYTYALQEIDRVGNVKEAEL